MTPSEISIIIGSIGLLIFAIFLASFFVFHNKKMIENKDEIQRLELEKAKKILVDSIEIQESERARIGADIHDDLGPTMSAMKLKINRLSIEKPNTKRDLDQLKMMVDETIKSMRSISHSLYPSTLEKYGLKAAIEELSNRVKGEDLTINTEIVPEIDALDFHTRINLYRIIQEFCNNSIKYSKCSEIRINIHEQDKVFHVNASDNGTGFDLNEKTKSGLGLRNMKMRAEAINYNFALSSTPGQGTQIKLESIKKP